MMNKGKIIFLNGVSSAGKSSLSRELVKWLPDYFHFSVDEYDYIIEKMEDRVNQRLIPIPTEHFFHRNIAMFSDKGINLIVDHILHDTDTFQDSISVLEGYPILFVGVHCPVDELDKREAARGDRTIGQAKRQLAFVHQQGEVYDVEVDTNELSMEEASKAISSTVKSIHAPIGWKSTIKNFMQC
jgi:chloramphenicol 3-O phosphotransferase